MFYCNVCAEENDWPVKLYKSYGKCEMCGKPAACNDIPTNELPLSNDETEELGEIVSHLESL